MTTEDPGFGGIELEISGFEDFRLIGRGGFGAVYEASQPKLNRQVAIKVLIVAGLDETTKRRFSREQKAMGALSAHPAIVTLHDSGYTDNGLPYLVMELMTGGSFASQLASDGPISVEEGVGVITRVSGAVQEAHNAGLLHRDIKPDNILISGYGEAKLTDFGIAAMMEGTASTTTSITATVEHAAPEVLGGTTPSAAADVYSLGSTLFALLAGSSPFRAEPGASMLAVITRALTEPIPDLRERGVPAPIAEVVERSTQKDPADRFASAAEFAAELTRVQGGKNNGDHTAPVSLKVPRPAPTPAQASDDQEQASGTRVLNRPPPSGPAATKPDYNDEESVQLNLLGVADSGVQRRLEHGVQRAGSTGELQVRVGRRLGKKAIRGIERAAIGALTDGNLARIQLTSLRTRQRKRLAKAARRRGLRVQVLGDTELNIERTGLARKRIASLSESEAPEEPQPAEITESSLDHDGPPTAAEEELVSEPDPVPAARRWRPVPIGAALAAFVSAFIPWLPFRFGLTFSNFHESATALWGDSDIDPGSFRAFSLGTVVMALGLLALLAARIGSPTASPGRMRWFPLLVGLAMVLVAGWFALSWSFEDNRLQSGFFPPGEEGLASGSVWLVFVGGVALLSERWWVRVPREAWLFAGLAAIGLRATLHLSGFEHAWWSANVSCVWDRNCGRTLQSSTSTPSVGTVMLFISVAGFALAWLLLKSPDRGLGVRLPLAALGAASIVIVAGMHTWDIVNTLEFSETSLEFALVRQIQLPPLVGLVGGGLIIYGSLGKRRTSDLRPESYSASPAS